MNNLKSYLCILAGAALGWLAALAVPGLPAAGGIPLGVAVGIAVAADRGEDSHGDRAGLCRGLRRRR